MTSHKSSLAARALFSLYDSMTWIVDRLSGYDVFISYSWSDGRTYAEALYRQLQDRRLSPFLDDERMDAGASLRTAVGRALRRSSVLVLVSTMGALRSAHVASEVRTFARSDRNIVPVVPARMTEMFRKMPTGGVDELPEEATTATPDQCQAYNLSILRKRIWLEEPHEEELSTPSDLVITKIKNAVGGFRRARIRVAAITLVALTLLALSIFAYVQQKIAIENERLAVSRQLAAQSSSIRDEQLDRSLLLALAANDVADTQAANQALIDTLVNGPPLVAYLRSHESAVFKAIRNQNGGFITADMQGFLTVWDGEGAIRTVEQLPSKSPVSSLHQRQDGTVVVGDFDGLVSFINPETLSRTDGPAHPSLVGQAAHAAWRDVAAELIVGYTGHDSLPGRIVKWTKSPEGEWIARTLFELRSNLAAMAMSPDGHKLAVGTSEGGIVLWDLEADEGQAEVRDVNLPSARQPQVYIKAIAFHPDRNLIAFDDGDGRVHVVDIDAFEEGESSICHRHTNDVYDIGFIDGYVLSVGPDAKIRVASLGDRCTSVADYQVTAKSLQSIAVVDESERTFITGSGDGSIQLWDLDQNSPAGVAVANEADIPASVSFSADDEVVVLTGLSTKPSEQPHGFARAYAAANLEAVGPRLKGLRGPAVETVFSPGNPPLLVGFDGWLWWPDFSKPLFEETAKVTVNEVVWPGQLYAVDANKLVMARRGGELALHDVDSGNELWKRSFWPDGPTIRSAAISRDGARIAVGGGNGWIQIVNGETGEDLSDPLDEHTLEVTGLRFGNNQDRLYSGSTDGRLLVWDLNGPSPKSIDSTIGPIQQIAVSADEELIAASTQRGLVALWSKGGERLLGTFKSGFTTPITALRFDHAGTRLAAAAMAGSGEPAKIGLWVVGFENWRSRACAIAARRLSEEEYELYDIPRDISPCTP